MLLLGGLAIVTVSRGRPVGAAPRRAERVRDNPVYPSLRQRPPVPDSDDAVSKVFRAAFSMA